AQITPSPDGTQVAYRGAADVIVRTISTGAEKVIGSYGTMPAFSPDGRRIAFDEGTHLVIINPDGTGRTEFAGPYLSYGELTWLPGSRWLLLRTSEGPNLLDTVTGELVPAPALYDFFQYSARP